MTKWQQLLISTAILKHIICEFLMASGRSRRHLSAKYQYSAYSDQKQPPVPIWLHQQRMSFLEEADDAANPILTFDALRSMSAGIQLTVIQRRALRKFIGVSECVFRSRVLCGNFNGDETLVLTSNLNRLFDSICNMRFDPVIPFLAIGSSRVIALHYG